MIANTHSNWRVLRTHPCFAWVLQVKLSWKLMTTDDADPEICWSIDFGFMEKMIVDGS